MKALKILGLAAVLVLMSGALAYGTDQVIDQVQGDDATADGRVCSENCLRVNNPIDTGEEVRTHTRTRLAWDETAECDCSQERVPTQTHDSSQETVRTQTRDSWSEDDEATRALTQTRTSQMSDDAPAVGSSGAGNAACD